MVYRKAPLLQTMGISSISCMEYLDTVIRHTITYYCLFGYCRVMWNMVEPVPTNSSSMNMII